MNSKLLFLLILTVVAGNRSLLAQSTAFTYQGRLDSSGSPSTGSYDLRVAVFDAADGGNLRGLLTNNAVAVSNGLFTTTLDFGFGVFNGGPRWLEIAVRSNGTAAAFSTLAPRQAVLPAPYAFWSANASQAVTVTGTVPSSGLNGVYSNPVSFNNPANGFAGDGGGLNNVNAAQLGGRSATQFWQTGGNVGTSPATDFLGTTDNQPLEMRVNGQRALRLEPGGSNSVNLIGGFAGNHLSNGIVGATIAGGGAGNYLGAAFTNRVLADFGTVGGGGNNIAGASYASVSGGRQNFAEGLLATVGGGDGNTASGFYATVAGGAFNLASGPRATVSGGIRNTGSVWWATVGGGALNTASGERATVAGGYGNTASGIGASVAGGITNTASGGSSLAAGFNNLAAGFASTALGYRARAVHDGSFVWADQQEADFNSTSTNQFNVRASGGVRFETGGAGLTVDGRLALLASAFGEPLVFSVNGTPALRIEPTTGTPNVIGGYDGNSVAPGVFGATVFGGGDFGIHQYPNRATTNFATVPGGLGNTASGFASTAMGAINTASGDHSTAMGFGTEASGHSSTAMGVFNSASGEASLVTGQESIAGGAYSTALGYQTFAGGESSVAIGYGTKASGFASTAMGSVTAATNNDSTAMGRLTLAGGSASTALGYRARALHHGSFVWADQQESDFDSTSANQFNLRASGGVRFETGGAGLTVDGQFKGGYAGNVISNGVVGGFIGGGGNAAFYPNRVGGDYASVLGGEGNTASGDYSTAMGRVTTAREYASTAMGQGTRASGLASTAMGDNTSASGLTSTAMGRSTAATNTSSTAMGHGTLAGGVASTAMGQSTRASGDYSTAMGYSARALHSGSFVWADQQEADFDSTAANQFNLRASGGVRLNNDTSLNFGNQTRQMINLWNAEYAIGVQAEAAYFRTANEFMWYRGGSHSDTFGDSGGGDQLMRLGSSGNLVLAGTISQGSDRQIKQDFTAVNPQEVLEKVAALSIQTWTYTNNAGVRHLGPVAQDFHAAFGLNGEDDKHIATVDAEGVALAAIQGLNQKVEEREASLRSELKRRAAENAELKQELSELKQLLMKLSARSN